MRFHSRKCAFLYEVAEFWYAMTIALIVVNILDCITLPIRRKIIYSMLFYACTLAIWSGGFIGLVEQLQALRTQPTLCWGPAPVVGFTCLLIFEAFVPVYFILIGCLDFFLGDSDYSLIDDAKAKMGGVASEVVGLRSSLPDVTPWSDPAIQVWKGSDILYSGQSRDDVLQWVSENIEEKDMGNIVVKTESY